jgi:hypothetical protein
MIPRLSFAFALALLTCGFARADPAPTTRPVNALTEQEQKDGWILLFDGKSTDGWRKLGSDAFPDKGWVVENGALRHLPGVKGGDIIHNRQFENFEFSFEWMIPKQNGNSGIKYRVQETKGNSGAYGPEYQCMSDGDKTDKGATGSLYEVFAPVNKKVRPAGEWNESRIIVRGNHVEHWLNGQKTVEFEFGSDTLKEAVAKSKFKDSKGWGVKPKGYIAITDHGDESHWRNLKSAT